MQWRCFPVALPVLFASTKPYSHKAFIPPNLPLIIFPALLLTICRKTGVNKNKIPLVVVLHDAGGSAKNTIKTLGDAIHAKADSGNCIVLYPDAVAAHWNSKTGEPFPATDTINDAGFVSMMVDFFIQQYQCNAERLYVLGLGNGGDLAKLMQCERPGKYAAVASINGSSGAACAGKSDTAVVEINAPAKAALGQAWTFLMEREKK